MWHGLFCHEWRSRKKSVKLVSRMHSALQTDASEGVAVVWQRSTRTAPGAIETGSAAAAPEVTLSTGRPACHSRWKTAAAVGRTPSVPRANACEIAAVVPWHPTRTAPGVVGMVHATVVPQAMASMGRRASHSRWTMATAVGRTRSVPRASASEGAALVPWRRTHIAPGAAGTGSATVAPQATPSMGRPASNCH